MFPSRRRAFTLIELLIVIAIIAILSIVVVLALNPAELLRQSRDQNRLSDLDTLTHAVSLFQTDVAVVSSIGSLGSSTLVYVSLSDPNASTSAGSNCSSLNLPGLPAGSAYHCAGPNFYRKTDGSGWIPLNFSSITTGSPLGQLPIDPQNSSSSRLYYTYATNGSKYEVTAGMESSKYKLGGSNDVITNDGGTLASVYEKGSQLGLEPLDYGDTSLVGYWPLDEGSGSTSGISTTTDQSGNGNTGTWYGTAVGANGTYYAAGQVGPWGGIFDGGTTYVNMGNSSVLNPTNAITLAGWVNPSGAGSGSAWFFARDDNTLGRSYALGYYNLSPTGWTLQVNGTNTVGCGAVATSTWSYIVVTGSPSAGWIMYKNGTACSTHVWVAPNITTGSTTIGERTLVGQQGWWPGQIDDVRIYNRALSAAEIQALYAGGK
jgi:prepilin-type N-terminal cleavage/methylation domain-containing protein